uniref:Uncharacterized protein n=1 Tax=Hyaloperonospora arabidopsidis (strain Emoy2) TaxID=559515 RepID=M4BX98_HYAAE
MDKKFRQHFETVAGYSHITLSLIRAISEEERHKTVEQKLNKNRTGCLAIISQHRLLELRKRMLLGKQTISKGRSNATEDRPKSYELSRDGQGIENIAVVSTVALRSQREHRNHDVVASSRIIYNVLPSYPVVCVA